MSSITVTKNKFSFKKDSIAKWIGYFSLLDLLILPYYQGIIIPISLPLIFMSFLFFDIKIFNDRYIKLFGVLFFVGFLSLLFSLTLQGYPAYFADNLKRLIQLLSSFIYFFYFRWLASRVTLKITPIVIVFTIWFVSLAVFFYFDPLTLGAFIRKIYGRIVLTEEDLEMHFRFAYIFADPNTAAYFFLIATSPFIIKAKSLKWKYIAVLLLSIVLLLAQSRGAILALIIVMILSIIKPATFFKNLLDVKKIVLLFMIGVIFYLLYIYVQSLAKDNIIIKYAFERIFENEDTKTGGSRFQIWGNVISHFIPLPFGRGYNLLVNGDPHSPHSDALRLIYSYGIISFIVMIVFLFRKIDSIEPLIISGMMPFFINTLIDEQKMFALFLSLLAIYLSDSKVASRNKNIE